MNNVAVVYPELKIPGTVDVFDEHAGATQCRCGERRAPPTTGNTRNWVSSVKISDDSCLKTFDKNKGGEERAPHHRNRSPLEPVNRLPRDAVLKM